MDKSSSIRTLQSFSPGWSDPEILEKTLAGRRELVDRLEELVIDGVGGPNKHQRLIIGFRGSGKTHVLRVLHNRLWPQEELKNLLLIIYLLEDELGVASFLDFVVRLLRAILRWYPEQNELAKGLEEIYDLPPDMQETRAVQLLLRAAGSKDILIIMENLSITFDKIKGFGLKGQQALRDLVQHYPRFMIFASSQALAESIKDLDAPFYSFFKVIHLRRLTLDEAMAFLMDIASAYENQGVVSFLNTAQGRGRMRAIYEFTGGNHRLLVVFFEFLTSDSVAKLSDLFIQALDPLKPFYQEQMRSLSAQQQKIVQFLSLQRNPCNVKDIARACLAAPNTVSSQMKDLLNKNFVSRIVQGRESYYEIAETLFRICQEAELEQEGAPVRLFVDFLGNLYTGEELQLRYRGCSLLANKLGEEGHIPFAEEAALYSRALSLYHPELAIDSMGSGLRETETDELHSLFQEMMQLHAYREILQMSKYLGEKKDAFILRAEAIAHEELGDTEKAAVQAMEALKRNADDPDAHILLARVLSRNPEAKDDALNHALRANELMPDNPRALASIGIVYYNGSEYNKALKQFEILNQKHSDYADGWKLCGKALERLERTKEAEAMYRRALELEPKNAGILQGLGILEFNTGRYEEALAHFQALNEIRPDYAIGWSLCGTALESLGRTKEAEAMFRKALELDPASANTWVSLSIFLDKQGQVDEAALAFKTAERYGADRDHLLNRRGEARRERGEYMEAIADYEEALQTDPYAVWPHFNIISALIALGKTEDALTRLPFAIESDRMSKTPFGNTITQSFFESCLSLFEHAPTASFERYLKAALDIIGSYDPVYIQRFEESLPLTIFALLKRNERISPKRFDRILQSLRNVVGKRVEVRVALRFLQTGIDYFKKKDRKALLKLTKEERRVFSKELGIS